MARPRKRHVQMSLPKADKNGQKRGGRSNNRAGRPKRGRYASERHQTRPELSGREPVLITARVSPQTRELRRRSVYQAIRRALQTALVRTDFRVVHMSIQRTHLHLLVEADGKHALSTGMQGLLISAAKRINAAISREQRDRRRGTVFPDRYHQRVISSPRQCRNAIRYVLNNWRRHGEDHHGIAAHWVVDPFSSAVSFGGWRELAGTDRLFETPVGYDRLPTSAPATWLLRIGWSRAGDIGAQDVPGPPHRL
jgi:REP element-mobilizing transposase RayT